MKGSVLSDDKVIDFINKNLVALELNITETGFPKEIEALKWWEKAFNSKWRFKHGFATSAVITPDGKWPIGHSGSGYVSEYKISPNYNADEFLKYLQKSRGYYDEATSILYDIMMSSDEKRAKLQGLKEEVAKFIKDYTNHGKRVKGK